MRQSAEERALLPWKPTCELAFSSGEPKVGEHMDGTGNVLTNQPWEKYQDLSSLGVKIDPNLTSINIYFSGQ